MQGSHMNYLLKTNNIMGETPIFPIRLPKAIKDRLRERAKEDNTTMAHVVTEALNQYLKS